MRLVVDANVFISALIARKGVPGRLLTRLVEDRSVFLVSGGTMEELRRTLEHPKIQKLLKPLKQSIERLFYKKQMQLSMKEEHRLLKMKERLERKR